jgi:Peptidoglycan-synthase activator LpoB
MSRIIMKFIKPIHVLLICALAGAGGCMTTAGALMYGINGPANNPATYVPPKDPTVVVVENYRNPTAGEFDADQIAEEVTQDLKEHNTVPMIDPDKLQALRDEDESKYATMKIQDLGKAVGAKQVIYVDLVGSGIETDPSQRSLHGHASVRVKVVDVSTGETRWPAGASEGYPLQVEIPYNDADPRIAATMESQMISKLADEIGNLFHEWKPETEMGTYDQ